MNMRLLDQTFTEAAQSAAAVPAAEGVPLSFAQRRIWLIHQLDGSSIEYNMVWAQRLRGKLDIQSLTKALTAIVERHESLRTRIFVRDGMPVQAVDAAKDFELPVEDLSGASNQQERIDRAVWREANEAFDLARTPLLRSRVLKIGPEDYIWIRVVHHIQYDGWSDGVFCRELNLLYDAFSNGLPNPLPPLPMQYREFVAKLYETPAAIDRELEYWRTQLAGIPERLELPAGMLAGEARLAGSGLHLAPLSTNQLRTIKQFSRANAVTVYMTMLAAFGAFLARYCGQDDIVVGSPIANRSSSLVEGIIGCFFNSLALRMRVNPKITFTELLQQVRETTLAAYDHRDVPFERVVEELAPRRNADRLPIYQVVFSMQDAAWLPLQLSGLHLEAPFRAEKTRSRADLELQVSLRQGEPNLCWFFNKDRFHSRQVAQMAHHYAHLLGRLIADPSAEIGRLELLDETDKALLMHWSAAAERRVDETTLPELFEKQAAANPDATAVIFGNARLTYGQLNEQANRGARLLIGQGIGSEDIVAIAIGRTTGLPIALLATIKAGAAYLPLDPDLPASRLSSILDDAQPKCVLTDAAGFSTLSASGHRFAVYDIADFAACAAECAHNPSPRERVRPLDGNSPAFVIYTSGSTGAPKGVIGLQSGIVNRLEWIHYAYPFEPQEPVLARTSIGFIDGSTELLGALTHGASVVLADSAAAKNPSGLIELIASRQVRRITVVPSLLRALLEEPEAHRMASCKLWISSGETLPPSYARRLHDLLPDSRLVNLYGCTECSGDSLAYECSGTDVAAGLAIWNTRAYVLNDFIQLNPIGVIGELYIGGVGVARGYLRRPELTADRFVTDPFGAPGGVMYRTGDLARWSADGNIEVLGRTDRQMKIRGQRIELGEIESAILRLPAVLDAAVVPHTNLGGETQLAAYIVPTAGAAIDAHALRHEMLAVLPDYMIPSTFQPIASIPSLTNGKADRSMLPAPEPQSRSGSRGPRSEPEATLCALFAEVLGMEKVRIDDDFFEMGGHSLSGTYLMNRVHETFGLELTLRTLFETATVAGLSEKYNEIFAVL